MYMYTDPEAKNSETFLPKHVTMPTFCPNPINGEPFFLFVFACFLLKSLKKNL